MVNEMVDANGNVVDRRFDVNGLPLNSSVQAHTDGYANNGRVDANGNLVNGSVDASGHAVNDVDAFGRPINEVGVKERIEANISANASYYNACQSIIEDMERQVLKLRQNAYPEYIIQAAVFCKDASIELLKEFKLNGVSEFEAVKSDKYIKAIEKHNVWLKSHLWSVTAFPLPVILQPATAPEEGTYPKLVGNEWKTVDVNSPSGDLITVNEPSEFYDNTKGYWFRRGSNRQPMLTRPPVQRINHK
jgi:hypothetical protein